MLSSAIGCVVLALAAAAGPAAAAGAQVPRSAPSQGLLARLPFDGSAEDASGRDRHGVARNVNLDRDVDGARRGSFRFNGKGDRIDLPIDVNPHTLPQVTLCAWVYLKSHREEFVVLSNDDGGGDRTLYTAKKGQAWVWAVSDGTGGFIGDTPVRPRQWTFLAARYDQARGTASVWVDDRATSGKARIDVGAEVLSVGARKRSGSSAEALVDEVHVYDRLLTDAELVALRALKSPPLPKPVPEPAWGYQVVQKVPARARPDVAAPQVALLERGTRFEAHAVAPAPGKAAAEWLQVTLPDGKTAFAALKYLERQSAKSKVEKEPSALEAYLAENFKAHRLFFWVAVVLAMVLGLAGAWYFPLVDRALGWVTGSDYSNVGWLPLAGALCGFLLAFLLVFAQDPVEYYLLENFTLWPDGYGFATWLTWGIATVGLGAFGVLLVESLRGAGLVHGPLRAAVQVGLSVCTFTAALVLTAALIVLAILLFVGVVMLSVAAATMREEGRKKVVYVYR